MQVRVPPRVDSRPPCLGRRPLWTELIADRPPPCQQPSARQKELEALFEKRRKGHVPQISITDDDHHVTEAIGSYYDDEPNPHPPSDPRPLSFVSSPEERVDSREQKRNKRNASYFEYKPGSPQRLPLAITGMNEKVPGVATDGLNSSSTDMKRASSLGSENAGPSSPGSPARLSRQSSTDTAVSQFPLNDIDYESSPAAVAQELSNLQAIRRMSMNVDTADPDLPSFGGVPTTAPKSSEDENDAARLFWVPARLHPELAPKEFKTFLEERVEKIKRRSGDADMLSLEGLERSGSGASLARRKSMLSRQVESQENFEDGADRLEKKRSKALTVDGHAQVELAELETLVNDPVQLLRRMSLDTARRSLDSGAEDSLGDDIPVLPPGAQSLKRSTRTAYRRGSLRKGERVPFSKRAQQRQSGAEPEEVSASSPSTSVFEEPVLGLSRVQTEPTPASHPLKSAYPSRTEASRRWNDARGDPHPDELVQDEATRGEGQPSAVGPQAPQDDEPPPRPQHRQFHSRIISGPGRTTAQLPGYDNTDPLPQIIETLPDGSKAPKSNVLQYIPERKSSHELPRAFNRGGAHMRPAPGREQRSSTLDDISQRPSPLPGSGNTSTDALTMVPTFDDRRPEKKDVTRKSSWKWILGSDDDGKKGREEKASESGSGKSNKLSKAAAEKTRLDVLQASIEGNSQVRGRESLVLNRDQVRLEEERKRESKKYSEPKKEKERESGLLSAIFGGKKKASDGDLKEKRRKSDRNLSPEPVPRMLKPDIDYNWTRFSILEERAIYRMAHIKLANPRRALYSQVLLSNFMYSYLAKVQMMHPQVQIPAAHQKSQQRSQQEQQPAEYSQYQRWQEVCA